MRAAALPRRRIRRRESPRPIGRIEAADASVDARDVQRERCRQLLDAIQLRISQERTTLLDRLHAAGAITRGEMFVAQRIQVLWRCTGLEPTVTAMLNPRSVADAKSARFGLERLTGSQGDAVCRWREVMRACGAASIEVRRVARDEPPADMAVLRDGLQRARGLV